MKKFIIFTCLILNTKVYAQLHPIVEISTGYNKMKIGFLNSNSSHYFIKSNIYKYPIYTNIDIGFIWNKLKVIQKIEWFMNINKKALSPFQSVYTTSITYTIKSNLLISYEHNCSHPIISNDIQAYYYRENYDKIYIKFKLL